MIDSGIKYKIKLKLNIIQVYIKFDNKINILFLAYKARLK